MPLLLGGAGDALTGRSNVAPPQNTRPGRLASLSVVRSQVGRGLPA